MSKHWCEKKYDKTKTTKGTVHLTHWNTYELFMIIANIEMLTKY